MKRNSHHDFQFNKIENALIDPKSSLPTGLDTDDTGYCVTIAGKLYVWSGTAWKTWISDRSWRVEIPIDGIDSEKADTDEFLLDVPLNEDDEHVYMQLYFDANDKGCLGTISQIGDTLLTNFTGQNNRRVLVTVIDDFSYFNIKDQDRVDYDDYKPIRTGHQQKIYNVKKAEFIFNDENDEWLLLSYEKFEWSQRNSIPDSGIVATSDFDYIYNLPFQGRYTIDAFVKVSEYVSNMGGASHDTNLSQTLNVVANNVAGEIDVSGITTTTPVTDFHWYNKSLQGSAPFEVSTNKQVRLNVSLPNGQGKQVHSGYVFIKYLGSLDNYQN